MLLLPAPCPGDAMFRCERESTLFGLPKEDTTRNQYLRVPEIQDFKICHIHNYTEYNQQWNVSSEQFNPNISVGSTFYGGLFPEPWSSLLAMHKGCFYKVGQFQLCKDSLVLMWLTACKYVFLFKEFALNDLNLSFELCRVVLVVCRFSNHKCRHGNVYMARCNVTRKKTVQVIIISNYDPTGCNKCLVYNMDAPVDWP